MRNRYFELSDALFAKLRHRERLTTSFASESSQFVRFNRAAIRQAGSVVQHRMTLTLSIDQRQVSAQLSLCGEPSLDLPRVTSALAGLRESAREVPEDPHLVFPEEPHSSERIVKRTLPGGGEAAETVLEAARDRDFVGHHQCGTLRAGFASSIGQRNWYEDESFNLDWSVVGSDARAVKGSHAGTDWRVERIGADLARADEQLAALSRAPRKIEPGAYRVFLAPAAMLEIVQLLGWGGFGVRARRGRTSPLLKLAEGEVALSPAIRMDENTADGVAADFQRQGFPRPALVSLVSQGRAVDPLCSPRSALEFDVPCNGADSGEAPESLDFAAGELADEAVLHELGRGLYISNLWYLNYSDRRACRTTGMTRFATFWVEGGRVVAPVDAMRFDESVYRLLGDRLVGLTREREMLLDPATYGARCWTSARLPGALVDDFTFTL